MTLEASQIAIGVGIANLAAYFVTLVWAWAKLDKRLSLQDLSIKNLSDDVLPLITRDRENASMQTRLDNQSGMIKNMQEENLRLWNVIDELRHGKGYVVTK